MTEETDKKLSDGFGDECNCSTPLPCEECEEVCICCEYATEDTDICRICIEKYTRKDERKKIMKELENLKMDDRFHENYKENIMGEDDTLNRILDSIIRVLADNQKKDDIETKTEE